MYDSFVTQWTLRHYSKCAKASNSFRNHKESFRLDRRKDKSFEQEGLRVLKELKMHLT